MSDRIQMDLADARLIELLRSRERDIVGQLTVMQMHMKQLQDDLQGTRSDFMTQMNELGQKYGVQLQHYTINPYTGEAVINPQMAAMQQRIQSALNQQKPPAAPPAPEAPAVEETKDGDTNKTQADEGPGVQTGAETAEGEETKD